jgi:hypothetical protein
MIRVKPYKVTSVTTYFFLINLAELKFMGSLTAYLYGVFPTQGFPNDTLYPFTYRLGEVVLENIGCLDGDKV